MRDDRGQSVLLALVFGIVIITAMSLIGIIIAFFGGTVLDEFLSVIVDQTASHDADFTTGWVWAVEFGIAVVLPLLVFSPVIWLYLIGLRTDTGPSRGGLR